MNIVVFDAQGGGIGRLLVEQLRRSAPDQIVTAVGTNSAATSAMLKGGATQAATGENAIRVNAARADVILAPIGMILCDGMLGEVTAAMACAISSSPAPKVLIPSSRCDVRVAGCPDRPLSQLVTDAVQQALSLCREHMQSG